MTQQPPVRIGIIGAGNFMRQHMEQFRHVPEAEVVAFCRRSPEALRQAQDEWGVPHGFTDYRDLLAMDGLDAVAIVTPTDSHRAIALDAIAAGNHVLCEKPLAITAADAKEMLDAAEAAGIVHAINFNQRERTPVGRMRRYMDAGYLGRLYHANMWWGQSHAPEDRPEVATWRFRPESGGGPVYELIHALDMCRLLGGEVRRLVALLDTAVPHRSFADVPEGFDIEVADSDAIMLEWKDGGYAVIHTSFVSKGTAADGTTNARVEVSGSGGRMVFDTLDQLRGVSGVTGPLSDLDLGEPRPQPYRQFVNAILTGEPVETSFYDGFKAAELVDAVLLSGREDRWVELA